MSQTYAHKLYICVPRSVLTIFLYAFLISSSLASRETPRSL